MKSNALTSILLGALAVTAFASLILCYLYVQNVREARRLQRVVASINFRQSMVNQLVADVIDYSRKTKDGAEITQILTSAGIKDVSATNPAGK
jgi:hypothetical protein